MKKLTLALAALAALFLCAAPSARAASSPGSAYTADLTFFGATPYHIESSTPTDTPVLLVSGSGYLYGVACSSGSSGDFAMVFDSASSSGITINTVGKSLSPAVLSSANGVTTCTDPSVCGQWVASFGAVRFSNGLVAIKHGSGGGNDNCQVYAVTDAQINNPSTH